MNLAIPVSAHDKHLLPDFVRVLKHFGGLEETNITLFVTPSAKDAAYPAAEELKASVHAFEVDFDGGWPIAPGMQFAATVFTLSKLGWRDPWLWMELDMLPVQHGWLASLRQEYMLCGKPFMGNVVPTAWIEDNKLVVQENDPMMMGCGVYPPNMHLDERFRPLLMDLLKMPSMNPKAPFDHYLRFAMRQAGVANSLCLADMWQTCNYRRVDGALVCDSVQLNKPHRPRGGTVPASAVVVHGCKDGSLAKLLLDDKPAKAKPAPAPTTETTTASTETVTAPTTETTTASTETVTAPTTETITASAAKPPPPKPAPKPPVLEKKELTDAGVSEAIEGCSGLAKDVALKLGVTVAELIRQTRPMGYSVVKGGVLKKL